jgi:hypothetical protein
MSPLDPSIWGLEDMTNASIQRGQGEYESTSVNSALVDKAKVAIYSLERGTTQGLAVADQLVLTLCPTRNLADNPGLQLLAVAHGFCEAVLLRVILVVINGFRKAVRLEISAVRSPGLVIITQRLVKRFPVPTGKALHIT